MAKYRITGPDGGTYEVTAPDDASEAEILSYVQQNAAPKAAASGASTPPPTSQRALEDRSMTALDEASKPVWSADILPYSRDALGRASLDSNAGIVGAIKRTLMAPGDVWQGKLNPFSAEGQNRATESAMTVSPVSAATRAGKVGLTGSYAKPKVKAPTRAELDTAASAGYDKAAGMGVDYTAAGVKRFADDAMRVLDEEGFIAELGPKTHALLRKLQNPPGDSVASLSSLDAFRKQLNRVAGSPDATEAAAANTVIRRLDEFLASPDRSAISAVSARDPLPSVPGTNFAATDAATARAAEEAARILKEARGNSAAGFRSDRLTGLGESAERRAAAANSGKNLGNTVRSRLASLLDSDKQSRGFSPEELTAIEKVVEGSLGSNVARRVSNLLGGGGGLGQSVIAALGAAGGGTAGGIPGAIAGAAAPAAIGSGARAISNKLTSNQLRAIDEMTRKRSPLYEQRVAETPYQYSPEELRAYLLRALLAGQANGGLMGNTNASLMD